MGGQGPRDAAIALKDTLGKAADDITGKAGDFHDLTADASLNGARAFGDTDAQQAGDLNNLGAQPPDPVPTPKPAEGGGGLNGKGGGEGGQGGQNTDGTGSTATCRDPVDPISGQMLCVQADVELPGILPLILRRAYASSYQEGRMFGPGWSSTLDQRVVIDADGIHYLGDDAQRLDYPVPTQPGQKVLPAAGARWPLEWDRKLDGIAITDPSSGWTRHFAPPPRDAAPTADGQEVRHLTRMTDRNGNWLIITRDADGVPTQVDHVGGYRVEIGSGFRAGGFRVEELRLLTGEDTQGTLLRSFDYDPAGRLVEIIDSSGVPYIYEYDDQHRIVAWIDRTGYQYKYRYDESGRVGWAGGEDGTLSGTFEYDDAARITKVADSFGEITEYHYDEQNHLTEVIDPLGAVTATVYDRYGRLLEYTDPLERTTRFTLSEHGDPVRVEQPDGSVIESAFNEMKLPTRVVGAGGGSWLYEYDERGNLVGLTDPSGAVTGYGFQENGAMASVTDALGRTRLIESDRAGLPVKLTDPHGAAWSIVRDGFGRMTSVTGPLDLQAATSYDGEGRPLAQTYADGSKEIWEWNAAGDLQAHTDQAGSTTRFETGPFHQVLARLGADRTAYRFTHDTEGRLVKVENPQQLSWTYSYDAAGRLVGERDFNGREIGYAVDPVGLIVARTNGAGQRIELERDVLGRVIAQRAEGHEVEFEYDTNGNLSHASTAWSRLDYSRDGLGRVVTETVDGRSLHSTYDQVGQRVEVTAPSGLSAAWEYNAVGRPVSLATADQRLTFGYDDAGRESYRWISPQTAVTQVYDRLGRVTARQLLRADGPADASTGQATARLLEQRAWTYRADGSPDSVEDGTLGRRTFHFDALGRIVSVQAAGWSESYAYDGAGNLTRAVDTRTPESATAGPRELDGTLLRSAGRTRYEYDAQGRLVQAARRTLSGGSKVWTYKYDPFDHLVEATTPAGETWRYTYDPLGRRTAKEHLSPDGAPIEEYRYTWDGPRLVEQDHFIVDHPTATSTTWVYEPGTFTPVGQTSRTFPGADPAATLDQQFHAVISDLIGTPTELVTPDGEIQWQRRAALWGASLVDPTNPDSGPAPAPVDCPLRFPGQYHDAETGLDYNCHRYYDPATGRYLTPDPLGLAPAPNQHTYVTNPQLWLDPLGLTGMPGPSPYVGNDPPQAFDTVPYRPTIGGLENHHGIMDAWLKNNVPGYKTRAGDSTTMALTPSDHAATKSVFRDWLETNYGKPVGVKVDWKSMDPREIHQLSENMFDAAGVPQAARDAYYSELNKYLYGLKDPSGCGGT